MSKLNHVKPAEGAEKAEGARVTVRSALTGRIHVAANGGTWIYPGRQDIEVNDELRAQLQGIDGVEITQAA